MGAMGAKEGEQKETAEALRRDAALRLAATDSIDHPRLLSNVAELQDLLDSFFTEPTRQGLLGFLKRYRSMVSEIESENQVLVEFKEANALKEKINEHLSQYGLSLQELDAAEGDSNIFEHIKKVHSERVKTRSEIVQGLNEILGGFITKYEFLAQILKYARRTDTTEENIGTLFSLAENLFELTRADKAKVLEAVSNKSNETSRQTPRTIVLIVLKKIQRAVRF